MKTVKALVFGGCAVIFTYYTIQVFFGGIISFSFADWSILAECLRPWGKNPSLPASICRGVGAFFAIAAGIGIYQAVQEEVEG